jgi:hypothetical protein
LKNPNSNGAANTIHASGKTQDVIFKRWKKKTFESSEENLDEKERNEEDFLISDYVKNYINKPK